MNLALVLAVALCGVAAAQNRLTVFTGGRVVDGTGKAALERGAIVVRDGRVVEVGPADRVRVPAGAERIDTTGKTVVPGFINAHGHAGKRLACVPVPSCTRRRTCCGNSGFTGDTGSRPC